MSLSVVQAQNLTTTGGQFIAAYLDGEQRGHTFLAPNSAAPAIANSLPSTVSVQQISQVDSAGTTKTGGFKVQISTAAADTVNMSSPQTIFVDDQGLFIVATTSNG